MKITIIGAGNVGGGLAAVPHGSVAQVVAELGGALDGKTVVDATNPLNDSCSDLTTSGTSAAEALQQQVPGAKVVKATVAELVTSPGLRPVDLGGLRMARTLEELAFANISLNAGNGRTWQSAFRLVGPQTPASA